MHSSIPSCDLPHIGDVAPPVGFPEPGDGKPADHIFITKTDYGTMLAHINELNAWIRAAAGCLAAGQR